MKRTTILVDEDILERYRGAAHERGTTVSALLREAVERSAPRPIPGPDVNPNQWLLDLAEQFKDVEWKDGPPIDSDEFKEDFVRAIERDSWNPEPAK